MNKQQLASTIWQSANQMRSKIEANEYKDYILGFMFYKYLSDREIQFLKQERYSDADIAKISADDEKLASHIRENIGYFIAYDDLFSTWLAKGDDFDVSDVRDALSNFDTNIEPTYKKLFENIFKTLQSGLSKLGETATKQTKSIKALLKLIKRIPMDGKQDYDVLGFIYEYLISMFAANAGKKAGEFYTPHEVSVLMSEIVANHLKDREHIKIYDPTSGSGSLLINIGASMAQYITGENKIDYYAQELKENTYNLTRMNLVMRGISPANINVRNGDTLEDDWPFFENDENKDETYNLVRVDAVVSNPPYSQKWDPKDKEFDPRFKEFGVAPKAKADYAFLLHELYHLEDDGIMTIVLPHGVLFRGGEEEKIRETLIERNHIEAIIGLPANIFFGTSIPTIIMVLKRTRPDTDVLIIDASKKYEKVGKNNKLRARDIREIVDTLKLRRDVEKFARLVSKDEIRENEYNLNIPRYVDSSEGEEPWDIHSIMFGGIPKSEVGTLQAYWEAFPGLYEKLFREISEDYVGVENIDIQGIVDGFDSVEEYIKKYNDSFEGFEELLKDYLIEDILDVNAQSIKETVCTEIFNRTANIKLIDRYKAFQILSENWDTIVADLEMIQGEGFDAVFQVEPNMVIKKKKEDEDEVTEVQEGWKGHILPFDLVQEEFHHDLLSEIRKNEFRLAEIDNLYTEILESLEEEELELSITNEDKNAFVAKEVKAYVIEALADVEGPEINALKDYLELSSKKDKVAFIENNGEVNWSTMSANKDGTFGKPAVNARILQLQMEFEFPEDSLESKMKQVMLLMDEESELKKTVKNQKTELEKATIETIETLEEEDALHLLELKWITPIQSGLETLPGEVISSMVSEIQNLEHKYATTYADIETEKRSASKSLIGMIGRLTGNGNDLNGLAEFKKYMEE
ncbi:type I restriction-modification system subunit M [Holdemanella porci]|uniref:type I restriction-modification system subunit M n=1 Tax=Holdemanella porci TaxID=2652276 RepID=UPI003F8F21F6